MELARDTEKNDFDTTLENKNEFDHLLKDAWAKIHDYYDRVYYWPKYKRLPVIESIQEMVEELEQLQNGFRDSELKIYCEDHIYKLNDYINKKNLYYHEMYNR